MIGQCGPHPTLEEATSPVKDVLVVEKEGGEGGGRRVHA